MKEFKAGQYVSVVERDEDNIPYDASTYILIAQVNNYAICSPLINGLDDLDYILDYYVSVSANNCFTDIVIFDVDDVFDSYEEAAAQLPGDAD